MDDDGDGGRRAVSCGQGQLSELARVVEPGGEGGGGGGGKGSGVGES